jgi:hypothetical protein
MALKGVIQGAAGTGGGQLSGSGVTSVGLTGPAPFITGPAVTSSGNLTFDFSGTAIPVADGGTGMGSFAANSILTAGPTSTGPFKSIPVTGLSSTFLDGTGNFSTPPVPTGGGTGTVTSVDLSLSSEFRISGNPVTGAGVLIAGFIQPLNVAHGGTGLGSVGIGAVVRGGLTSTAPFQGTPLTNLTSTFLDGTGNFSTPPSGGGGGAGTVTSVDLALSSEFTVSGNPITNAGQLVVGWRAPLGVAHGGTGMGSFGPGLVMGGLTSTGNLQGLPLTNLTSTFLAGDGIFRIPINPGGTVQSVALAMTSEFSVQGTPITGSGTFTIGFTQPLAVAHGGTGLGSIGVGAILKGGLTSTAPVQGLPLTNLTSNFLRGDGVFGFPPSNPGSVTSVDLSLSSEFRTSGNPITGAGTLVVGFVQPLSVAHGGTAMGSFGPGVLLGGLTSTGPIQGLPLTNLTSNFLRGDGVFAVPPTPSGGTGTVTSVALVMSSEFIIAGSPITTSGQFLGSWVFQTQNFIFGGPGTGTLPGTPSFRAMTNADVPQALSGKTLTSSTFQNPTMKSQVLTFGSAIKWNMQSGAIGLLGMDSTAVGLMDTPANVPNAGSAILRIMQLGTGLPNIGWNAYWKFEAVAGARTLPVLSSGFSNIDVFSLYMESTAGYAVARKNFK